MYKYTSDKKGVNAVSAGRPNIALLAANLIDDFSFSVAKGAMAAAERLGADLFVFPGKYIGLHDVKAAYDVTYEYQYNVLFQIAAEGGFDYIIAAVGTIAYALDTAGKEAFLERLGDTPSAKYFLDELPSADTNEIAIYWNSPAIFVGAFFSSLCS